MESVNTTMCLPSRKVRGSEAVWRWVLSQPDLEDDDVPDDPCIEPLLGT